VAFTNALIVVMLQHQVMTTASPLIASRADGENDLVSTIITILIVSKNMSYLIKIYAGSLSN
jgi:hypothetical protein